MIVFVSNFLNHHQFEVANKLYHLTQGRYRFIETEPMPDWIKKGGYSEYENLPWLIQSWKSAQALKEAKQVVLEAEVLLWTNNLFMNQVRQRLKSNKLTFDVGERWLKRGLINLLSPRLIKSQIYYHLFLKKKTLYKLCASAYAANDLTLMRSYKNHMFKWGYFTSVDEKERHNAGPAEATKIRIIQVARFISWKHLDLSIKMASRLKRMGYTFEFNIFGGGPEEKRLRELISGLNVQDEVRLCGNRPNQEILQQMRNHDIFLLTSDRNEGWGAVINEAMGQRCAIVASYEAGSVPFLIADGINGLTYKHNSLDELTEKVRFLLDNPEKIKEYGDNAHHTINTIWSPTNAAKNFLKLVNALQHDDICNISEGPCSPAYPI